MKTWQAGQKGKKRIKKWGNSRKISTRLVQYITVFLLNSTLSLYILNNFQDSETGFISISVFVRTCRVCLKPNEVRDKNDRRVASYNDEDSLDYPPVFFDKIKKYGDAELHKWIKVNILNGFLLNWHWICL